MSVPVTREPTDVSEKVTAAAAAAAGATIAIWGFEAGFGIDIPAAVEAAVVTVLVFLGGYFIRDRV